MTKRTQDPASTRADRPRWAVAVIVSLVIFLVSVIALWALTTLGFVYALATATPVTVIVACSIYVSDGVAEVFAAIVEGIVAVLTAIAEACGAVLAGIAAALAAVFSIFS